MQDIKNLSYEELSEYCRKVSQPLYRSRQIFEWLYQKRILNFDQMANLPLAFRSQMGKDFFSYEPALVCKYLSRDGTIKYLFEMKDGEKIETVVIPALARTALCVSTQAGCKFGCRFCASGLSGFQRNLMAAEILSQVILAQSDIQPRALTHIVFMGTGEPLDNYDNVLKSIRTLNAPQGLHIGARRVTISTCGLVPQIRKLAGEGLQLELSISLHGYDDDSRQEFMPVARKYPFKDLIAACRDYGACTNRQITFEYLMIKDKTCVPRAAEALGRSLKGLICKLNLIPYNENCEFDFKGPSYAECLAFQKKLKKNGIHSTIRKSRGSDIRAACGQLRMGSFNLQ